MPDYFLWLAAGLRFVFVAEESKSCPEIKIVSQNVSQNWACYKYDIDIEHDALLRALASFIMNIHQGIWLFIITAMYIYMWRLLEI